MYCVSVNLSSNEWMWILQAATKQWPQETLSRSEILRRYALMGVESWRNLSPCDAEQLARQFQDSIIVSDERLRH